jgi:hypothetical protein
MYVESLKETFTGDGELPSTEEPGRFYNYYVLVHTVTQIQWFGSLLLMNAARCVVCLLSCLCGACVLW